MSCLGYNIRELLVLPSSLLDGGVRSKFLLPKGFNDGNFKNKVIHDLKENTFDDLIKMDKPVNTINFNFMLQEQDTGKNLEWEKEKNPLEETDILDVEAFETHPYTIRRRRCTDESKHYYQFICVNVDACTDANKNNKEWDSVYPGPVLVPEGCQSPVLKNLFGEGKGNL